VVQCLNAFLALPFVGMKGQASEGGRAAAVLRVLPVALLQGMGLVNKYSYSDTPCSFFVLEQ
jgi:hypothetical protein